MRTRDDSTTQQERRGVSAPSVADLFSHVRQESARAKVYAALREAIISGRLKTGEKLTEVSLATSFNVSRSVIREALRELVRDGLVEQNAYKNTRVVQLTPDQVDEILQMRLLLESEAVRLAHGRLAAADRADLRARVKELDQSRDNPERHARLDLALHERIWELSGNRTLRGLLHQITAPLFAMGVIMRTSRAAQELRQRSAKPADHRELIEALCGGSVEQAMAAMRSHIGKNWVPIKHSLETFSQVEAESTRAEQARRGRKDRRG